MKPQNGPENEKGLTTGATVNEAQAVADMNTQHRFPNMLAHPVKPFLIIRLGGFEVLVKGRAAQTLRLLIQKGPAGFTSGEASPLGWARRTSAYIKQLRDLGIQIVTQFERAGDALVGRYILVSPVVVLKEGAK